MRSLKVVVFLVLTSLIATPEDSEWKLAKDKNNIKIYTRTPSGKKIKEFKAYTYMKASVEKIATEIRNVEEHDDWIKDIKNPEVLKKISTNEYYSYYELSVPFPFDNRDMVMHTKGQTVDGVFSLIMTSTPTFIQPKDGLVRMPVSNGKWVLTPQTDGTTKVFYQFLGDPAGSIPAGIVNMFVVDGPYTSLMNLKERVE